MKKSDSVLAFDIGGTKVAFGVVKNKRLLYYKVVPTNIFRKDPIQFIIEIFENIPFKEQVRAIVLGVPAVVGNENIVLSAPNLKEIEGLNFKKILENEIEIETLIENDVNLSVLGETFYGAAQGAKYVFGVFVGTGLGAGITINGKIYKGGSGAAAEIGHIYYPKGEGILCGCGKVDCVELYASGKFLEKLRDIYNCSSKSVFLCKKAKDKVDKFIEALSFAISTGINLLDPDVLVIGGGLLKSERFPWNKLVQQIKEKTRAPLPRENVKIVRAQLGYKACLLGGYAYFLSRTFS